MTHLWIAVLFSLNMVCCEVPTTLRLVNIVFRHGDRSPISTFANDPVKEKDWPQGFGGQLTKEGKIRAHTLGVALRARYGGFISTQYLRNEVYIRSTDTDRTLMTAQLVAHGLYPAQGDQVWLDNLPWQPIPIHSQPDDPLLSSGPCARLDNAVTAKYNEPENKKHILNTYKELYELLKNNSGDNITNIEQDPKGFIRQAERYADAIYCEQHNNYVIAPWLSDPVVSSLQDLRNLYHYFMFGDFSLAKYRGILLGQFIKDMKLKEAGWHTGLNSIKAFIYSGHDTTLWSFLQALRLYDNQPLTYTSCIMVELHKNSSDNSSKDYFVRIYLRDGLSGVINQLQVPGCMLNCPLSQFINITASAVPDDWYRDCLVFQLGFDLHDQSTMIMISSLATVLVLMVLSSVIGCCCHRKCSRRRIPRTYGRLREASMPVPEEMPMMNSAVGSDDE